MELFGQLMHKIRIPTFMRETSASQQILIMRFHFGYMLSIQLRRQNYQSKILFQEQNLGQSLRALFLLILQTGKNTSFIFELHQEFVLIMFLNYLFKIFFREVRVMIIILTILKLQNLVLHQVRLLLHLLVRQVMFL